MTEREKLIELLLQDNCPSPMFCSDNCKYVNSSDCAAERCADHLLANGITILPCKVGDTIYTKYKYSFKVESIEILKDKKVFRCGNDGTDDYTAFYEDEIGTEVFLTREEMEKALAKETAQNGLAYATPGFELLEG